MFYNYYYMLASRVLFLFLILLFYFQITHSVTSPPTPFTPDPTYHAGVYTLGNTPIQNSNTYTVSYVRTMSTASLNASLAIAVISFEFDNKKHGWQQSIISLNATYLIMNVTVINNNNKVTNLKFSYLVSCSPFLDINYVSYPFAPGSDALANYSKVTLPSPCSYLDCRCASFSVPYNTKTNGKVLVFLAGYTVSSTFTPYSNTYEGITLQASTNGGTTYNFSLNITVYGAIQVTAVSFFYVAFQPAIINIMTYRNIMYSRKYVGCFYDPQTCLSVNGPSNSSFTTSGTNVNMVSPYTDMLFYGLDRFIATNIANPSTTFGYTTPSYSLSNTGVVVNINYQGNNQNQFTLAFSAVTIQTFYCPSTPPIMYYSYNSNTCTDACNNWVNQYANATNYCQPCGIYCYTCFSNADNCTACYSNQNRVLSAGGVCGCDVAAGFYDDYTSIACPKCYYACATCSGPGGGLCLTCVSTSFRIFNSGSCVCKTGYFDNGAQTCSTCHYTCGTATCNGTGNTNCLTCNNTRYRTILGNFSCGCMAGYYDGSPSSETCLPCLYSCLTCWGTNTYCTNCDNSVMLRSNSTSNNTCTCSPGTYDAGIPICQPCYTTCQTCNGPTRGNCLNCSSISLRYLNGSTCVCNSGYYDLNDVCTLCNYTCATCTGGTQFTCSSCNASNFRTFVANLTACICMAGYYEAGVTLCSPCSSSCLTCSPNATYCTSCANTTARYLYNGTCLCSAGYIDIYLNGTCTPCHYSCATCSSTSSISCITCVTNRTLSSNSCLCTTGFYDNGTATCVPCSSTCLNCTNGLATSCTACNSLYLRYLSALPAGSCLCSPGYYDNSTLLCVACNLKCLTCTNSTACVTCDLLNNHRVINGTQCVCLAGYFDTGAAICSTCTYPCITCTSTATFCTSCPQDRYLSATNLCLCNLGTFLNATSQCQTCHYTCLTCTSNATTCLSCYSNSNRNLTANSCPCLAGFYDSATIVCPSCYYTCATCTTATTCTLCASNSFRLLQANGSCICSAGYYDDGFNATCQLCDMKCLTCSFYSQCLSCDSNNFRTWDSLGFSCPCVSGYYDNGTPICVTCHYSCSTCTGSTNSSCLTCQNFRVLNTSGYCLCQNGTYQYLNSCTPCSLQCLTCSVTGTNCTSCYAGSYLNNYQCLCSPGFYLNGLACSLCDYACQTCISSSTTCLSCNTTYGTVLSGTSCVCPSGTYQTPTLVCASCNPACLTCFNSTNTSCLSCDHALFRTYNSTTHTCLCNAGYYDNGTLCLPCISPCSTCNGGSSLNCTSCISGYSLIGSSCRTTMSCTTYYYLGYCVSSCPNTTYPSAGICIACINNCLTCLSATVCTSCQPAFYLLTNGSCLGSCPNGTYAFNNGCTACPQNCTSCVYRSSVICLTCATSFYLTLNFQCLGNCPNDQTHIILQSHCIRCLAPCDTCVNLTSSGCLSCLQGYIYFNGSCLTNCPNNYYISNGICQTCPSTCLSCTKGICSTCINGYYLSPDLKCIKIGYFLNANVETPCHPNCKTCTNSSFSSCLACNKYRGDSSSMSISGYCDCWKGSVDLGNGTCDQQSYYSLQKATQTLVSATTATTYVSVITGLMSMNLMSSLFTVSYQQLYGNFYYVNASAVGQTDKVLQKYSEYSPNTYLNKLRVKNEPKQQNLYSRRLYSEQLQQMQSLYMRGESCEYLFDWALATTLVIIGAWISVIVLAYILPRIQNAKTQKKSAIFLILSKINQFLRQSFFIILHLLTINEISFYGIASLKIQLSSYPSQKINYTKLALSFLVLIYYLLYILRLIIACIRFKDTPEQNKKFMVLLACSETIKKKLALSRMYLPIIMLRSALISVCLVLFAYDPLIQTSASIGIFALSFIYSLRYCPYRFYIRAFVRVFEILFMVQLFIMTLSILKPQVSRMMPAMGLIAINYLQMGSFVGMSVAVLLNNFYGKKCCNKEENIVAPLDPREEQQFDVIKSKKIPEQTMHEIDQQQSNKKIANSYQESPQINNRKVANLQNNFSQQNMFPSEDISIDMSINEAPHRDINQSLQAIRRVRLQGMKNRTPNFRGENC